MNPSQHTPMTLRFAINLGNSALAYKIGQEKLGGISVALAERVALRIGREAEFCAYESAAGVVGDADANKWDVAFLAVDPLRQDILRFTEPFLTLDATIMVPENSRIKSVEQIDHSGNVINVEKGAVYDLFLTRHLKHATLQRYSTSQESVDMFVFGQGDMVAGLRQELPQRVAENKRFRVLPDSFAKVSHAICVSKEKIFLFNDIENIMNEWLQHDVVRSLIQEYVTA